MKSPSSRNPRANTSKQKRVRGHFGEIETPALYTFVSVKVSPSSDAASTSAVSNLISKIVDGNANVISAAAHPNRRLLLAFRSSSEALIAISAYYDATQGGTTHELLAVGMSLGEVLSGESAADTAPAVMANALSDLANSGQVLVANSAFEALRDQSVLDCSFIFAGSVAFDFQIRPERVTQIVLPGLSSVRANLPKEEEDRRVLPHRFGLLIGRNAELDDVHSRITRFPVVTLTGASGIGKTHLASRVAFEHQEDQDQEVLWVELSGIQTEGDFLRAIANAFGVRIKNDWPLERILLRHVAGRPMLVVFDGCDRVISPVRNFVRKVLELPRGPRFLLTSSKRLGIDGENTITLQPLELPLAGEHYQAEDLEDIDSTALFMDRARDVKPDFSPSREEVDAIVRLCSRFGGHPLSIVLAAKRLKESLPSEIALGIALSIERNLPRKGKRSDSRHDSLLDTFRWSLESLSPAAVRTLKALLPVRGPWTAEDAAAFADLAAEDARDAIEELLEAGLVVENPTANSVRSYGLPSFVASSLEALVSDQVELTAIWDQFCLVMVSKLATISKSFSGPDEVLALHQMEAIRPDLTAAFEYMLRPNGELKTFVEAMIRTWHYWYKRNHIGEGLRLIDRAIRLYGDNKNLDNGRIQSLAGAMATKSGEVKRAETYLLAAIDIGESIGHDYLKAVAQSNLVLLKWSLCDFDGAVRLYESIGPAFERDNTKSGLVSHLQSMATILLDAGRVEQAKAVYERAKALIPDPEDTYLRWMRSLIEGQFRLSDCQFEAAAKAFRLSIKYASELSDFASVARGCYWVAECDFRQGKPKNAAMLLGMLGTAVERSGSHLYPINEIRIASLEGRCMKALGNEAFGENRVIGALLSPSELLEV